MNKLKNGDKVKLISITSGQEKLVIGNVYTIRDYINDDDFRFEGVHYSWTGIEDVELVTQFEVGKKYICQDDNATYTITKERKQYYIEYEDKYYKSCNGWFEQDDLEGDEPYVEQPTEELTLEQVCKELGREIKIIK